MLLLLELPFWRAPALRRTVHLALVASLAAVLAIQALKSIVDADAVILIPAAILIGAAAFAVYARVPTVRSILTALSPAPLVFPALFLLASGVSKLVLPEDDAEAVGPSRTDIPIVMVVMDEFASTALMDMRQRIDAARFPNFSKLAASSTWYRNATTVADFTPVAVPAILTGKRVKAGTVPIASELPDNVFTLLGPGHAMNVEEPVTALCPESLCRRSRDPTVDRWSSLVSDLSVVAAHRVAPRDLESDLPVVDQSFEGFGETGDDARRRKFARLRGRCSLQHAAGPTRRLPAASCAGWDPAEVPVSTSCTSPCPTYHGSSCLRASSTGSRDPRHRGSRTTTGRATLS